MIRRFTAAALAAMVLWRATIVRIGVNDALAYDFIPAENASQIAEYEPTEEYVKPASVNVAYDFGRVCRIVYHEAGGDEALQRAVATCILNACNRTLLNPEEVCRAYRYTTPWESCPERCEAVCEDVLILGNRMAEVGSATLFYAPRYCSGTWHETQVFVCEIGGVRFFEER